MNPKATADWNHCWATLLVEALHRQGVRRCYMGSGSRNSPLVMAIARHRGFKTHVHVDERGAAFAALGWARVTGKPALWLTTSGTAVANGLPAVVEASQSFVPMLLLTADRPPELRGIEANQTITQPGIFGAYVRWEVDMPCPGPEPEAGFVLATVEEAVSHAVGSPPGPVHVNCMYREPLTGGDPHAIALPAAVNAWLESGGPGPSVACRSRLTSADVDDVVAVLGAMPRGRGLLVLGELRSAADRRAARELATALDWPVLADIASGLRMTPGELPVCADYESLFALPRFLEATSADVILWVGGRLVSKRLQEFIGHSESRKIRFRSHPVLDGADPKEWLCVVGELQASCTALVDRLAGAAVAWQWKAIWCGEVVERVRKAVDAGLSGEHELSEPIIARVLSERVPHAHALLLGNSMPVRDFNRFATTDGACDAVMVNRGASGIDGLLATAVGVAEGREGPVTVVVGDLSFLHDLNSLALMQRSTFPVVCVVINNDGGGIFEFLPVAKETDVFEAFFGTPHGLTFESAAGLFGIPYASVRTVEGLVAAYERALASDATWVIEVRTDRATATVEYARLQRLALKAFDGGAAGGR